MGGVVGRIFNEFAMVVTVSIAASALISLTLTPMLAARLPADAATAQAREEPVRARLRPGPGRLPRPARPLPALPLHDVPGLPRARVGLTVWLFAAIPKGFFPTEDIGQLSGLDRGPSGHLVSDAMVGAAAARPRTLLQRSPYVAHVVAGVGSSGVYAARMNQGRLFVELKPKDQRPPLRRGAGRPAPAARRGAGHHRPTSRRCRTCASAARRRRASTSSSCRASTRTSRTPGRASSPTRWAATARPSPTSPPTCRTTRCRRRSSIDRDKARALGIIGRPAPLDALQRASAPGRSRPSTDRPTATR